VKCTGDFHTHSEYSHGKGKLRENIEVAIEKGLRELAITDHGPQTWNFIRLGVKNAEELLSIAEKIRLLQLEYPEIKLYSGVEANILNRVGELDVPASVLDRLDITAVGYHLLIFPINLHSAKEIIIDNRITYRYFPGKRDEIRQRNTEALIKTIQKYDVDFITHPGYGVDIDTYELARVCAEENTYLEINARHGELTEDFVRAAAETDVKFIINSDAHSPEQVGEQEAGLKIVERLNLTEGRVVNVE